MNFEDAIKKIQFLSKNEEYLIVKTLGNNSEFKIKVEDNKIKVVNSGNSFIFIDNIFWDKVVYRMSLLEEDNKYKGMYYTITHWSHPENPNTLFSPTIPAIIRKLEKKDSILHNKKKNNLKYVIIIAVVLIVGLVFVKRFINTLSEVNKAEQYLPHRINGKTAFVEVSYDRNPGNGLYSTAVVEANNTVINTADVIKEVVSINSNLEKIVLRIHTTCKDNYGYKNTHTDEIIFNSYEISEMRKYNKGEDIAYGCYLYYHKLNEFWDTCGQNPSSLVY